MMARAAAPTADLKMDPATLARRAQPLIATANAPTELSKVDRDGGESGQS